MPDLQWKDESLKAEEFAVLMQACWKKQADVDRLKAALAKSINVTAREAQRLVGCLRIISDDYLMSVVSEILVLPEFRDAGMARQLLEFATLHYDRNLLIASHRVAEKLMNTLGWEAGYPSFVLRKEPR